MWTAIQLYRVIGLGRAVFLGCIKTESEKVSFICKIRLKFDNLKYSIEVRNEFKELTG